MALGSQQLPSSIDLVSFFRAWVFLVLEQPVYSKEQSCAIFRSVYVDGIVLGDTPGALLDSLLTILNGEFVT